MTKMKPSPALWIATALLAVSTSDAFLNPAQRTTTRNHNMVFSRLKMKPDEDTNPFSSFLASVLPQKGDPVPVETEEERVRRVNLARRQEMAALEIKRQERVREDALPYLFLFSLQLLPLVATTNLISQAYFLGTAITTVYLGSRQKTIYNPEQVSKENALSAPIGASISIGLLYFLIKLDLDPTTLYAILVSIFGALSISDVAVPILRNLLPVSFATSEIPVPKIAAEKLKIEPPTLPADGTVTLFLGFLATALYWAPVAMEQKFLVSNVIAWSIGMATLGAISLGSFQTGAILLAGLFFYDIFFVFGTDVMMTVALKIEAPVKFLYPAPPSATPRVYPFSVLGLGDVVIPGLFVRFMAKIDEVLKPEKFSYASATTIAYGIGLATCFVVNDLTKAGQPALLYLDPACIGAALACGVANDQLPELWNFEEPPLEEKEELRY